MTRRLRTAVLAAGIVAVSASILHAVHGDWAPAGWALAVGAWAAATFVHRGPEPPAPEPTPLPTVPERGEEFVVFDGGPLDGSELMAPFSDLGSLLDSQETFPVRGTRYRIDCVHHTAYTATVEAKR